MSHSRSIICFVILATSVGCGEEKSDNQNLRSTTPSEYSKANFRLSPEHRLRLEAEYPNEKHLNDARLFKVYMDSLMLRTPKERDLLRARVGLELIKFDGERRQLQER